jgi:hypothetical protein
VVLVFFPVFVLVDPGRFAVVVVAAGSSFFCAHELKNATAARRMIKVTSDVFI